MSNAPIETRAHWTAEMLPDPKSTTPHRDASPPVSLCVLYGLVEQARKANVRYLDVDEIELALDWYTAVMAPRNHR